VQVVPRSKFICVFRLAGFVIAGLGVRYVYRGSLVKGVDGGKRKVRAVLRTLRSSRKLVVIGVTVLVLGAGTSAAALFIGKDRLLGRSYGAANGMACEALQTVNIRKDGATWVRKYVKMDNAEGIDRVKTALRVAAVEYSRSKADLVQISVLDRNGPSLRSNMRGRAIAAQVVFIADPSKFPDDAGALRFNGFYYDGAAGSDGQFYGLRIDVPYEDMQKLALAQDNFVDCANQDGATAVADDKDTGPVLPLPVHLGDQTSKEKPVVVPAGPEEINEDEGDNLSDLLTSTPVAENSSFFSLSYWKSLLFGKGPVVAVAAE
jgi:hypothetical protein